MVYKIVLALNGIGNDAWANSPRVKLVSYSAGWLRRCNMVARYSLGKTTYPSMPGSKLFAFSSLEYAEEFWKGGKNSEVLLECEYTGLTRLTRKTIPPAGQARKAWQDGKLLDRVAYVDNIDKPDGTCLVDSLTPIKVVRWYDHGVLGKGECPWK